MNDSRRLRLAFIIARIELGGAEMMLWKLLSRLDRSRFVPYVIALSSCSDSLIERFHASGIDCRVLGARKSTDVFALFELSRVLSELRPDLVQGWMYYGNLAATLAMRMRGNRQPVLWAVRGSLVDAEYTSRATAFSIWLGGKLSSTPALIINNSVASARDHERRYGYKLSKCVILPNGFDTEVFRPSTDARIGLRRDLGLEESTLLVGLVGRYHPIKGQDNFLRAAGILKERYPNVHYVLAGERVDSTNTELSRIVEECGLRERIHLLGRRDDMPSIAAALDVAVSASSVEAFANVIGEAMSCGVPCVVTDVGDSSRVVGDTGLTVPARDPEALARALGELIAMGETGRRDLGTRARQRILDHFSLDAVVRQYEDLYVDILTAR